MTADGQQGCGWRLGLERGRGTATGRQNSVDRLSTTTVTHDSEATLESEGPAECVPRW